MNLINRDFLYSVVYKYGFENQKIKAIEEMSELILALCKELNHETNNVEEEIADVIIMIEQLKLIYDNNNIDKHISYKLKRLKNRMEE